MIRIAFGHWKTWPKVSLDQIEMFQIKTVMVWAVKFTIPTVIKKCKKKNPQHSFNKRHKVSPQTKAGLNAKAGARAK